MRAFFEPTSITLVGSTDKENTAGRLILQSLLLAKDKRKIYPVNPNRDQVFDLKCYPNVNALPEQPELAVIVTPAATVPGIVEECGKACVKNVIIVSA